MKKQWLWFVVVAAVVFSASGVARAEDEPKSDAVQSDAVKSEEAQSDAVTTDAIKRVDPSTMTPDEQEFQKKFSWWPTDAAPGPVEDKAKGGYWWMPKAPGPKSGDPAKSLWGNRGYIYVRKVIFDYQEDELPPAKPQEMRPSLIIRKIIKNVKVYFDYDKSDLRDDTVKVLADAVYLLKKNPDASILITGNCDVRGTEQYNDKLGKKRGQSVREYMLQNSIGEDRIRIISRGKLDAIAPVSDLVGMAKDRNAQFMVAVIEEVMLPAPGKPEEAVAAGEELKQIDEHKYVVEKEEKIEGDIKVTTKEYVIKKNDTLWKIAEKEYGDGNKWKHIYRYNKDRIKDPNRLKAGVTIVIPIE